MIIFHQKGIVGFPEWDSESSKWCGTASANQTNGIDFSGRTLEEAYREFREAVADYKLWEAEGFYEGE